MRWMRRAAGPAAWHRIEVTILIFACGLRPVTVPLVRVLTLLDLADHLIPQTLEEELDGGLEEGAEEERVGETGDLGPRFPTGKL